MQLERDAEMATLSATLGGPAGRDRDVAEWKVCADVCGRLGDYAPGTFEMRHPDGWTQAEQYAIDQLRQKHHLGIEELRDIAKQFAGAGSEFTFGKWRDAVMYFEAEEASKLRTLCWVLSVLHRFREMENADAERIDPLVNRLADFMRTQWRARLHHIPIGKQPDGWAARGSRRYDLLPMAWRFV